MPHVPTNGIRVYYDTFGSGEPLLLLMGLGGSGSGWRDHVAVYRKKFRCIVPDNRGTGQSDAPEGPYTTAQMAMDALGVLDALDVRTAHVAGISMGGGIAQELALAAPERVQSLTLNCTWAQSDVYTVKIFEMLRSAKENLSDAEFFRLLYLWVFPPDYYNAHPDEMLERERQMVNHPHPTSVAGYTAQIHACIHHDTWDRLRAIAAPTLITCGDADRFIGPHYSQTLVERIAGATLEVFPGGGHGHHWEQAARFQQKTMAFLQSHPMS